MEMFIPASNATGKYVIDGKVAVLVLDPYDPAAYRLVILDSDWLTQVILISDWLTQVILISDWLISCCLQNWVHQYHCPRQGSADNLGGGRQAETGHRGGPRDGDQCGGSQHQDGQPFQRSSRCFGQGKFLLLIGWHRAILISDWLTQSYSNLWLVVSDCGQVSQPEHGQVHQGFPACHRQVSLWLPEEVLQQRRGQHWRQCLQWIEYCWILLLLLLISLF